MSGQHYTDADVNAVHDFAWRNRDGIKGSGSQNGARELLDRIAPAIAARALREAADAYGIRNGIVTTYLKSRADEIDPTP